ncbi:YnfU family zinc-binding protein [Klebsiella pneumoniae]|uniref:YnfU family zinc-binding protein n=1 Tax=Klebsiella pneumoniae TaxID=573 RepID=UPI0009412714|nr:YnfU family zinc-binding protein [Klebsiella pneumoniae]
MPENPASYRVVRKKSYLFNKARKNSKNNRNYLIKCTCPSCTNQSEHSYTRVQKGSALMCPHCSKIFTQDKLPTA